MGIAVANISHARSGHGLEEGFAFPLSQTQEGFATAMGLRLGVLGLAVPVTITHLYSAPHPLPTVTSILV